MANTPHVVGNILDTLTELEHDAAKVTPGALLADLRNAQATLLAYEERFKAIETDLAVALATLKAAGAIIFPLVQPLLVANGITLPADVLLLLGVATPEPAPEPAPEPDPAPEPKPTPTPTEPVVAGLSGALEPIESND